MRIDQLVVVLLACIAVTSPGREAAAAQTGSTAHGHQNDHHGDGDASSALVSKLVMGKVGRHWPTDTSLRNGMAAFDADHAAIHAGRQTDAQYDALASTIEHQVQAIVANCKLPPDADAQLHYVVGDLLQAVNLLRGGDPARSRHDGARLVHGALNAYGKYFDDPGWAALKPVHDEHDH